MNSTSGLRQLGDSVLVDLLSSGPDALSVAAVQGEQAGEQQARVLIARLASNEGREVINGNDSQLGAGDLLVDGDRGLVERTPGGVDGDGVVLAVGVAADVADDPQTSAGNRKRVKGEEGRSAVGSKVDAVDEDVGLGNLLEGATLGGLGHILVEENVLASYSWDEETSSHERVLSDLAKHVLTHLRMEFASNPAVVQKSTAPLPQRPRAPMTMTRGSWPLLALTAGSTAALTWATRAGALSKVGTAP